MLVIPKTLAINSGYDAQETIVKLVEERNAGGDMPVGLDLESGEPMQPAVSFYLGLIGPSLFSNLL